MNSALREVADDLSDENVVRSWPYDKKDFL